MYAGMTVLGKRQRIAAEEEVGSDDADSCEQEGLAEDDDKRKKRTRKEGSSTSISG